MQKHFQLTLDFVSSAKRVNALMALSRNGVLYSG
jgi:hypothetical protein